MKSDTRNSGSDARVPKLEIRQNLTESQALDVMVAVSSPAGALHDESPIAEEEALKRGMEEKPKEFVEKGAEVYAKR